MVGGFIYTFAAPTMYSDVTYYKRGIDDVHILSDTSVWYQYTLYDNTYPTFVVRKKQQHVNTYVNLAHTKAGYRALWLRVQNHTLDTVYIHRWGTQKLYTGYVPDYHSTFISNLSYLLIAFFPFLTFGLILFLCGPFESMIRVCMKKQTWIYVWVCVRQVRVQDNKVASPDIPSRKNQETI